MKQVVNTNKMYLLEWENTISEVEFLVKVYKYIGSGTVTGFEYNYDSRCIQIHFSNSVLNTTNIKIYSGGALLVEELQPVGGRKITSFNITTPSNIEHLKEIK